MRPAEHCHHPKKSSAGSSSPSMVQHAGTSHRAPTSTQTAKMKSNGLSKNISPVTTKHENQQTHRLFPCSTSPCCDRKKNKQVTNHKPPSSSLRQRPWQFGDTCAAGHPFICIHQRRCAHTGCQQHDRTTSSFISRRVWFGR